MSSNLLRLWDIVDPIEGILSTFRFADWQGAYQRAGLSGLVGEFMASLASTNCATIWVRRDTGFTGAEIESLLFRHGVRIWGRGFVDDEIYFRVKKRQARWAEYLLLRRGVPVTNSAFDPRNRKYAERYSPGDEPPNRSARSSKNLIDLLRSFLR